MADSSRIERDADGERFTSMVSCKWLIVIGILTVAISLVAGIILGVIAVHFSNATNAAIQNPKASGDVIGSFDAQQMASTTSVPTLPINEQIERDLSKFDPTVQPTTWTPKPPSTVPTDEPTEPSSSSPSVPESTTSFRPDASSTSSTALETEDGGAHSTSTSTTITTPMPSETIENSTPDTTTTATPFKTGEDSTTAQEISTTLAAPTTTPEAEKTTTATTITEATTTIPASSTAEPQPTTVAPTSTITTTSTTQVSPTTEPTLTTLEPIASTSLDSTTAHPTSTSVLPDSTTASSSIDPTLESRQLPSRTTTSPLTIPDSSANVTTQVPSQPDMNITTTSTPSTDKDLFSERPPWLSRTTTAATGSNTTVPNGANSSTSGNGTDTLPSQNSTNDQEGRMIPGNLTTEDSVVVGSNDGLFELKECPGTPGRWITADSFCDQKVDCPSATDEIGCSCRSRLESSKICDGIFDCPGGEDEAACRGCNETHFTCDITRPRPWCIPLRQRCDGMINCPDGMDESSCNILSPTQQPTEISVPKFSSGYVMRNIQSKWYPLCVNASKDWMNVAELAFRICWMTVGSASGDVKPDIQKINQSEYEGKYAVFHDVPGRPFLVVDQCPTAQLLTVSCPTPRCGRKAFSLQEASSTLNLIIKNVTTTTTSNQTTTPVLLNTAPSRSRRYLSSRIRLSELQAASQQLQVRKRRGGIERIVGGRTAVQGAWPWVVAVIRSGKFVCGGTLVSSRWIASAAHCFQSFDAHYFEVQLSMLRRTSFSPLEQIRAVQNIFMHPKFNMLNLNDDVALLAVNEPFQLNQWAAPICLPSPDYRPALGTNCTVIGWGDVAESGPESDALREVTLPITSCENVSTSSINVDTLICAGFPEGKKDACKGDSGGPLVCPDPDASGTWIFAGIVSFGLGCARPGQPGAYTRLTHHLNWISQTMENPDATPPTKFPKMKCPGITCQRGTGACLPKTYICDDVVDCFGAEDEINCGNSTIIPSVTTTIPPTSLINSTTAPLAITTSAPIICTEEQFSCTRFLQCVDKTKKCDMVSDCKDGSDEIMCTCADYLRNSNQSALICDDNVDCLDQSDEAGCRTCADNEQYSYLSSQCIPNSNICDRQIQTSTGDEETNCVALVPKSGILELNRKGKPIRQATGFLTIFNQGGWEPVCVQNWGAAVNDDVCTYLGYSAGLSFNLVNKSSFSLQVVPPVEGFLWKSNGKSPQEGNGIVRTRSAPEIQSWHTLVKRETEEECRFVNMTCASQQCGTRPNLVGWDGLPNMEGRYPWHASVFVNGSYLCGATLISSQWLMVTPSCVRKLNLAVDYVATLLGARRFTMFAHPNEQISRIIRIVPVGANQTVLLQLERPVQLTEFVNPICLASWNLLRPLFKKNECVAVGRNGTLLASALSFKSLMMTDRKTTAVTWANNETIDCSSKTWTGSVMCSLGNVWYAVAHFERPCPINASNVSYTNNLEFHYPYLDNITNIAACPASFPPGTRGMSAVCAGLPDIVPAPECPERNSWRCPLGSCLRDDQVCDGVPNCRDMSDEKRTCSPSLKIPKTSDNDSCLPVQFSCGNGTCILQSLICDGVADCSDGSDESSIAGCPTNVFRCLDPGQDRSKEIVPVLAVCNSTAECSNRADEKTCMGLASDLPLAPLDNNGNPLVLNASGYLVARTNGTWSPYCSTAWNQKQSIAVCKVLGFTAEEVSFTQVLPKNAFNPTISCPHAIHLRCGP